MTALTLYTGDTTATDLTSAASLVTASGGTGVTHASSVGTATGYGEIVFEGTTNAWGAGGSIGSQSGNGALWDVTTLEGQTLASGTFTAKLNLATVGASGLVGDIYVRFSKWKSGTGYTTIGTISLTGQTFTTTLTGYTVSGSLSSTAFATGEKLYVDVWVNVTTNGLGTSSLKLKAQMGTGTTGVVGSNEFDTQGYSATPSPAQGGTLGLMGAG